MRIQLPTRSISFPRRPLLMGIVNVNDDSFSGDGSLDVNESIDLSVRQVEMGADVIDVGAESARTNRAPISVADEITRFQGYLRRWREVIERAEPRDKEQVWPPILSVNTWRSEVVKEVLPAGGEILNDMSALNSLENAELAYKYKTALLIMHSVGEPKVPHTQQQWQDVMTSMHAFFVDKCAAAKQIGLTTDQLILDPGIDFAKQCEDNLKVYGSIRELQQYLSAVLLPVSRKTVIGDVLGIGEPTERDAGTIACIVAGMVGGVQLFRVHNVDAAWQAVKVSHAVIGSS